MIQGFYMDNLIVWQKFTFRFCLFLMQKKIAYILGNAINYINFRIYVLVSFWSNDRHVFEAKNEDMYYVGISSYLVKVWVLSSLK